MKKGIPIILICLLSTILSGCGGTLGNIRYNHRADDAISRAVYKAVGAKELYYEGQREENVNIVRYDYYINKEKEGLAEEVIDAVNVVLEQEKTKNKIAIPFIEEIPGAGEPMFIIRNYIYAESFSANYEKLQYLWILGTDVGMQESIYNDPETYKNFPDIRYLRVSPKIQKAADEAGIDWYEYWPDLEAVEVYSLWED
ncbi:MAG: hypothetical protein NC094_11285 [Bacteroidales bacterium]|nr:hypothetical protein [Lachnoclostridium sp.]MCM1465991.1 hypothetical protein [Bacteroidales bacterium]